MVNPPSHYCTAVYFDMPSCIHCYYDVIASVQPSSSHCSAPPKLHSYDYSYLLILVTTADLEVEIHLIAGQCRRRLCVVTGRQSPFQEKPTQMQPSSKSKVTYRATAATTDLYYLCYAIRTCFRAVV